MIGRFFKLLPFRTWLLLAVLLLGVLLILGWCDARRDRDTAKDQATIGDSRTTSAIEAIEAIGENAAANSATAAQVERAQDAVEAETDPVRRDAVARVELCKLQHPDGPC